jgi:hypothetical protein
MRRAVSFALFLLLAVATAGFSGTISSCANWATSPTPAGYTQFTCELYNDASQYNVSLSSVIGPDLTDNAPTAGYVIVTTGSIPVGGQWDQSLWVAQLFFVGDYGGNYQSDSLSVSWSGFPDQSTIETYNTNIWDFYYGANYTESEWFLPYNAPVTTYAVVNHTYDVIVPEPGTIALLGFGLALLGGAVLKRRRTAGRAA